MNRKQGTVYYVHRYKLAQLISLVSWSSFAIGRMNNRYRCEQEF
jgi:hypothetical protein